MAKREIMFEDETEGLLLFTYAEGVLLEDGGEPDHETEISQGWDESQRYTYVSKGVVKIDCDFEKKVLTIEDPGIEDLADFDRFFEERYRLGRSE